MKKANIIVKLLILASCITMIIYFSIMGQSDPSIISSEVEPYNNDWYIIKDDLTKEDINIPFSIKKDKNETIKIYKEIGDIDKDIMICFNTKFQYLKATIEEEVIYEQDPASTVIFNSKFNLRTHAVKLNSKYANKILTIEVGNIGLDTVSIKNIYVGNGENIANSLWKKSIPTIIFASIFIFISIILFAISVFIRIKKATFNYKALVYLGVFSFIAALWRIVDLETLELFIHNKQLAFIFAYLLMFMLPVPMILLMGELCNHNKKVIKSMMLLLVIEFIVFLLLAVFGIVSLLKTQIIVHSTIIGISMIIMYIAITEFFKYKNKDLKYFVFGLGFLSVAVVINMILFYLPIDASGANIFTIGMLGLTIIVSVGQALRALDLFVVKTESLTYKRLAYTDAMTNIGNRLMFNELNDNIVNKKISFDNVIAIMFDLDNLKEMNDEYGHEVGDEVICIISKTLEEVFTNKCSYRMGGDEFLVVLFNKSIIEIEEMISLFKAGLVNNMKSLLQKIKTEKKVSVSLGYSLDDYSFSKYNNFDNLVYEADKNMYIDKRRNKQ